MNISTAKDIITLSIYASDNSQFRKVMNTDMHMCYSYTP
jgi:tRNA threonylcarbamoyladenosine modification (KEOPS) complex  Pcc1 subunit